MPATPYPHTRQNLDRIHSWQLLRRVWLLTILAMLQVTSPALANHHPLATYCLTRIAQEPEAPAAAQPATEEPPQIAFRVEGERFQVVGSRDRLLLRRRDDPDPFSQALVPQREFRHIKALALGKDGWLWIDGGEIDYMAPLNLQQQPPTFGLPVALPELMRKPCVSLVWHFLKACMPAQSSYSTTLNRAFVTGHRVTLLGWSALTSFEIVAGKVNLLPTKFQGARFVTDIPHLNGSLLRGPGGEALFYDGISVIPLLVDFPERPADYVFVEWIVETFASGRTYLRDPGLIGVQPFLMELKAGPTLVPIPLSEKWLNCHAICACGW